MSGNDVQYRHVSIRWIDQPKDLGGTPLFEGILLVDGESIGIRVLTQVSAVEEDESVTALCNSIGTAQALAQQ